MRATSASAWMTWSLFGTALSTATAWSWPRNTLAMACFVVMRRQCPASTMWATRPGASAWRTWASSPSRSSSGVAPSARGPPRHWPTVSAPATVPSPARSRPPPGRCHASWMRDPRLRSLRTPSGASCCWRPSRRSRQWWSTTCQADGWPRSWGPCGTSWSLCRTTACRTSRSVLFTPSPTRSCRLPTGWLCTRRQPPQTSSGSGSATPPTTSTSCRSTWRSPGDSWPRPRGRRSCAPTSGASRRRGDVRPRRARPPPLPPRPPRTPF
mmetsp:Transcript_10018/g.29912  ORF Transcript_10018/g.29912 Transcript_10018/m.29912 type:complete len:268 (+) Transcript_10018:304-1107(+)